MVCEIERDMPARELMEWMEYESLEPFGAWRDNYHAALIASILANANRKPNAPPFGMHEFFYQDAQTVREKGESAAVAFFEGLSDGD